MLLAAAAGVLLPPHHGARADVELDYVDLTHYTIRYTHVPDLDQRRAVLPAIGAAYALPTTAINWMCYFANHGQPQILPGPGYWPSQSRYDEASFAIQEMALDMLADPDGCCYVGKGVPAIEAWLAPLPVNIVTCFNQPAGSPTMRALAYHATSGAYLIIGVGWYLPDPYDEQVLYPWGEHWVSLAYARELSPEYQEIGVRDPSTDEGNWTTGLHTQSLFRTEYYLVENLSRVPMGMGTARTMTRINGLDGPDGAEAFIHGIIAIYPQFVLTRRFEHLRRHYAYSLAGSDIDSFKEYDVAGSGAEMYLVNTGIGEHLFRLDPLSGESTPSGVALTSPTAMAIGRLHDLYVLDGGELVHLNPHTMQEIGRVTTPAPGTALCYDDAADKLVVLAPGTRAMYRYPSQLDVVEPETFELPEPLPLSGDTSICWSEADNCALLADPSSLSLWQVLANTLDPPVVIELTAPSLSEPITGLDVGNDGRIFVASGGVIREYVFSMVGPLIAAPDPWFEGVETDGLLVIGRTMLDAVPAFHDTEDHTDEIPIATADGVQDCDADVDGDRDVDVDDFVALVLAWGEAGHPGFRPEDANQSGAVDVDDLLFLLLRWGACP
jgi:hypothetical protein